MKIAVDVFFCILSYSGWTYREVAGIHVQFVRVKCTKLSVDALNVVQIAHSFVQTSKDHLSMGSHLGVS